MGAPRRVTKSQTSSNEAYHDGPREKCGNPARKKNGKKSFGLCDAEIGYATKCRLAVAPCTLGVKGGSRLCRVGHPNVGPSPLFTPNGHKRCLHPTHVSHSDIRMLPNLRILMTSSSY